MKKIPTLFKRDYSTHLVYDDVTQGCEWVLEGQGTPTVKFDGTACMVEDWILYKRYDRRGKKGTVKPAPDGWFECQEPDPITEHWPGWVPVDFALADNKWFKEAWDYVNSRLMDGTYELVGQKVQGNPYGLSQHLFWTHEYGFYLNGTPPREFNALRDWLETLDEEGVVWHHTDGRMAKIKRRDFGFSWPMD